MLESGPYIGMIKKGVSPLNGLPAKTGRDDYQFTGGYRGVQLEDPDECGGFLLHLGKDLEPSRLRGRVEVLEAAGW